MTDWTTIVVAGITGVVGLTGGVFAQLVGARSARDGARQADDRAMRDERRTACIELLATTQAIDSLTAGAVAMNTLADVPVERLHALNVAKARVQLAMPAAVWASIEPYVNGVIMRSNSVRSGVSVNRRNEVYAAVVEQGLNDDVELDRRRAVFIDTVHPFTI